MTYNNDDYQPQTGKVIKSDGTVINEGDGYNANGSQNVVLIGRNATKTNIFSSLAITDTSFHFSSPIDSSNASKLAMHVYSSLNQAVTIKFQINFGNVVNASGSLYQVSIGTGPTGQYLVTGNDVAFFNYPIADNWTIYVSAATAPTSGSITVDLYSLPI